MVDMSRVSTQTNRSNLEHAFCVAEQLGVARLLDPEGENHTHNILISDVFYSLISVLVSTLKIQYWSSSRAKFGFEE